MCGVVLKVNAMSKVWSDDLKYGCVKISVASLFIYCAAELVTQQLLYVTDQVKEPGFLWAIDILTILVPIQTHVLVLLYVPAIQDFTTEQIMLEYNSAGSGLFIVWTYLADSQGWIFASLATWPAKVQQLMFSL